MSRKEDKCVWNFLTCVCATYSANIAEFCSLEICKVKEKLGKFILVRKVLFRGSS